MLSFVNQFPKDNGICGATGKRKLTANSANEQIRYSKSNKNNHYKYIAKRCDFCGCWHVNTEKHSVVVLHKHHLNRKRAAIYDDDDDG